MEVRLFDFAVFNEKPDDDDDNPKRQDNNQFMIQMFGITEMGETCSIKVDDYEPFFYFFVSYTS